MTQEHTGPAPETTLAELHSMLTNIFLDMVSSDDPIKAKDMRVIVSFLKDNGYGHKPARKTTRKTPYNPSQHQIPDLSNGHWPETIIN
ncbi:hypothetical protein MTBPR1_10077 [Candidatus Terasakiella magnetica]|uniref:Uncharacterized protein n=1 Tax=Candidatus Terasakiella magnetica TaxID=1867952 RepID=A0A1C3RC36_9PROT|nr:hypothetical protein [Candidatus Terasakiella magnetica]SCA54830.1 hypothetical protein MTBPR1_10077 [Candidatus Terasakiella magnetica]